MEKVKDALKVGQEVEARVIKVDKAERRIGLSIKAANYDDDALKREADAFDTFAPGEDMVGLGARLRSRRTEEYRPGDSRRSNPSSVKQPVSRKRRRSKTGGVFAFINPAVPCTVPVKDVPIHI